jgi:nucleoside-diphosphate-sugar epimerase
MAEQFLVTGGAGFIGSNLVGALLERGYKVRVLDNFSTGKRENLVEFEGEIELIEGDIRDLATCHRAMAGVDYVLHQAALGSVPRSVDDPITTNDVNINGTLNVLVAARDAGVKRLVAAASSSAYGDTDVLPKVESMTPRPLSPYAVTKLVLEHYISVFHRVYGLEAIALRYFNVFGPKQDPTSTYAAVIPKFVSALLRDQAPTITGDGEQSRDFSYIENVIDANLKACFTDAVACGQVYNVACNDRVTLNEIYREISRLLEKRIAPIYGPDRRGDVKHSQADIELAKRYLGYEPLVDWRQGLYRAIDWYKANL